MTSALFFTRCARQVGILVFGLAGILPAGEVQLGDKAFYPSPERPVGYRGDGNGYFPGATPVAEWWEGTPVERQVENGKDRKGGPTFSKFWDFSDQTAKNLVWKTEMPSWANTQPLVIGDRVVTYAEPDLVVCCDAKDGKVLWTTVVNPWTAAGADPAKAGIARTLAGAAAALENIVQLQWHFGTCGRYLGNDQLTPVLKAFVDKDAATLEKTLTTLDPQGGHAATIQEFKEKIVGAIAAPIDDHKKCWDFGKKFPAIGKLGRRASELAGKKIPMDTPWGNMVGWCMSVPVSDGEFIYVALGQGQTACLDLNGKIVWQTWFEQKEISTHHVISPLLADGVLVDMHNPGVMRGLDAKTGKQIWEAPAARPGKSEKGGYYVANHRIVRLGGVAFLVSSQCAIIRIKDGKTVGEYDYGPAYHGGTPIAGWGDVIVKAACGDGWQQPFRAFRLTAESADKVTAVKLWDGSNRVDYTSRVVTPQAVWLCTGDATAVDPASGKMLSTAKVGFGGRDYRLIAGSTLIALPDGSSGWSARRADGKAVIPFMTTDISDPKAPKVLSARNVLGGVNLPRNVLAESLIPATWAQTEFVNAKGGRPGHMVNTDTCLMPQGNRLFIRTVSHLYCIGDPTVAYDWDPTARPARISAALKSASAK